MTEGQAILGIDFGTSHTVAVLASRVQREAAETLLFDSTPLLPSGVFVEPGNGILFGLDAQRSAQLDPSAFEPNPKRRIDDAVLLLGGTELRVVDAVSAVLRRVRAEAVRVAGAAPDRVVLTHPAGWGAPRRGLLSEAASAAGLGSVELVAEPVAAAAYFADVLGHKVPAGAALVVFDFGGGTFDISVVCRTDEDGLAGWKVLASDGLDDVGGIDLDAAVVDWVARTVGVRDPALWQRLERPETAPDRRHRRHLWNDARSVKEQLSRASSAGLGVPLFDIDTHLTRAEFDGLARPWIERTVALTTRTLFSSGVTADRLAGVFLVGGSSRLPQVATLLHQALGVAPVIIEHPELVVAHGSVHVAMAAVQNRPTITPSSSPTAVPDPPSATAVVMPGQTPVPVRRPGLLGWRVPAIARTRTEVASTWALIAAVIVATVTAFLAASSLGGGEEDALWLLPVFGVPFALLWWYRTVRRARPGRSRIDMLLTLALAGLALYAAAFSISILTGHPFPLPGLTFGGNQKRANILMTGLMAMAALAASTTAVWYRHFVRQLRS